MLPDIKRGWNIIDQYTPAAIINIAGIDIDIRTARLNGYSTTVACGSIPDYTWLCVYHGSLLIECRRSSRRINAIAGNGLITGTA